MASAIETFACPASSLPGQAEAVSAKKPETAAAEKTHASTIAVFTKIAPALPARLRNKAIKLSKSWRLPLNKLSFPAQMGMAPGSYRGIIQAGVEDMQKPWSPQTLARWIGVLLILSIVAGGFGEGYLPSKMVVAGDAGATAGNIVQFQSLFRLGYVGYAIEALCDAA